MPLKVRGFTLIELLVVISIISLLSSVVFSSVNSAREKARIAAGRAFEAQTHRVAGELAAGIYEFNECTGTVASDRSGFGNNGALTNMVGTSEWSADTPYGTGCSLDFDGSNDQVRITNNFQFSTIHGPSAVSLWFKADTLSGTKYLFTDNCNEWGIRHVDSTIQGVAYTQVAVGSVSTDRWYHVVLAHEHPSGLTGTLIKVYIDGTLKGQASRNITSENGYNDAPYAIGADACTAATTFDGKIDNVRVFTKALTAREVGVLYAHESELFKKYAER